MAVGVDPRVRAHIEKQLEEAGWIVRDGSDPGERSGVALRDVPLNSGFGTADYLLFLDGSPVGALDFRRTEDGHRPRTYGAELPLDLGAGIVPLPFLYVADGLELHFANGLDPVSTRRRVAAPRRPETLRRKLDAEPLHRFRRRHGAGTSFEGDSTLFGRRAIGVRNDRPSTLRGRLRQPGPIEIPGLLKHQVAAIEALERSLAANRRRSLIQMSAGTGKTRTAVAAIHRHLEFAGAERILYLVERPPLVSRAIAEFTAFLPDECPFGNRFPPGTLDDRTGGELPPVVVATVDALEAALDGGRGDDTAALPYVPDLPPEAFDFVYLDDCLDAAGSSVSRVADYFDAFWVGLTPVPAKHLYDFFHRNLVSEYRHDRAVADGVCVGFDVVSVAAKAPGVAEAKMLSRKRRTRAERWSTPDEDLAQEVESVVDPRSSSWIRRVVRACEDSGDPAVRPHATLCFAEDENHAEEIAEVVRKVLGSDCPVLTETAPDLPENLRALGEDPGIRFAVVADDAVVGIDLPMVDRLVFLRRVDRRRRLEHMKAVGLGRFPANRRKSGVRHPKIRCVMIDGVGLLDGPLNETRPLDLHPGLPLAHLLDLVVSGESPDASLIRSLAGRLAHLALRIEDGPHDGGPHDGGPHDGGPHESDRHPLPAFDLHSLAGGLIDAQDPDRRLERAQEIGALKEGDYPDDRELRAAAASLLHKAIEPLRDPGVRSLLIRLESTALDAR